MARHVPIGIAPHSLRAVTPDDLAHAVALADALGPATPLHIHVAEQTAEVADCLAWSGARPVQWLLDHAPVGPRWCLIHATHMDDAERARLAGSGAVAGLCQTTEANLGDGIFPLRAYLGGGRQVRDRQRQQRLAPARSRNCAGWNMSAAWKPAPAT